MEREVRIEQLRAEINSAGINSENGVIDLVKAMRIKRDICIAWLLSEMSMEERDRLIDFVNKSSIRSLIPVKY